MITGRLRLKSTRPKTEGVNMSKNLLADMASNMKKDMLKAHGQESQPDPVSIPSGDDQKGQEIKKSRVQEVKASSIPEIQNSRVQEIKNSRNPEVKKKPKKVKTERVNVNLNLEKKLTERAKIQAIKEGRPFSRLIEAAIDEYMKGR